jgi:peptide/nickel transport system permease protein
MNYRRTPVIHRKIEHLKFIVESVADLEAKELSAAPRQGRRLTNFARRLFSRPMSAIGATITLIFLLVALFGPWIAPYGATEIIPGEARQPPSIEHWFGTDNLGRDVFSRVILGAREIVLLSGLGTLLAVISGTFLGLLAGYRGGWLDEALMRLFDSLLALPALLLALLFLGTLGRSEGGVLVVIVIVYTPIVARVVRSVTLSIRPKAFVEAARLQGEKQSRILIREILPSTLPALTVEAALRFSYAIFLVASLGFLGIGVQPPSPNWGLMVEEARDFASLMPWAMLFPALAISIVVIGVNLLADGLKTVLLTQDIE